MFLNVYIGIVCIYKIPRETNKLCIGKSSRVLDVCIRLHKERRISYYKNLLTCKRDRMNA